MTDIQRLTSELESAQQEIHGSRAHSTKVEQELSAARGQIEELRASAVVDSTRWQEQDQTRQQTISLLVSEKASLIASVQRLQEVEIGIVTLDIVCPLLKLPFLELQEKQGLFLAEHEKAAHLTKRVQELEITNTKQGNELEGTFSREKELLERVRDQVGVPPHFSSQSSLHVHIGARNPTQESRARGGTNYFQSTSATGPRVGGADRE